MQTLGGIENQVEDPRKWRNDVLAVKNECKLLKERVRVQKKLNEQNDEQL